MCSSQIHSTEGNGRAALLYGSGISPVNVHFAPTASTEQIQLFVEPIALYVLLCSGAYVLRKLIGPERPDMKVYSAIRSVLLHILRSRV